MPLFLKGYLCNGVQPGINLVYFLVRQASLKSEIFPLEDVYNGLLIEKEGNPRDMIFHDRSFNIDGVINKDDDCNFDHYVVVHMCPEGCDEIASGDCECMRKYEHLFNKNRFTIIIIK